MIDDHLRKKLSQIWESFDPDREWWEDQEETLNEAEIQWPNSDMKETAMGMEQQYGKKAPFILWDLFRHYYKPDSIISTVFRNAVEDTIDVYNIAMITPKMIKKKQSPYLNVVKKWIINGSVVVPEDSQKVKQNLEEFHRQKQSGTLKGPAAEINNYETEGDLYSAISKDMGKGKSGGFEEAGAKLVFQSDPWKVYRIDDFGAGEYCFSNTNWCVAHENYFDMYKPPYYMVTEHTDEGETKFALAHLPSGQFKYTNDNPIDKDEVEEQMPEVLDWLFFRESNPEIWDFIESDEADDVENTVDNFVDVFGNITTEIEQIYDDYREVLEEVEESVRNEVMDYDEEEIKEWIWDSLSDEEKEALNWETVEEVDPHDNDVIDAYHTAIDEFTDSKMNSFYEFAGEIVGDKNLYIYGRSEALDKLAQYLTGYDIGELNQIINSDDLEGKFSAARSMDSNIAGTHDELWDQIKRFSGHDLYDKILEGIIGSYRWRNEGRGDIESIGYYDDVLKPAISVKNLEQQRHTNSVKNLEQQRQANV